MLNKYFWGTAKDFKWEMRNPICDGVHGYAQYAFSYTSTVEGAEGKPVVFEGFGLFQLANGKIQDYAETFDTGIALTQINFPADCLTKLLEKYAEFLHLKGT